jgi:hypothetical protein
MAMEESAGPIPDDNQPGHHPAHEQDKPDLDDFAHKLGISDDTGDVGADDVPAGADDVPAGAADVPAGADDVPVVTVAPVAEPVGPGAWEEVVAAPVVEVGAAAWDFARASVRLFVITPFRVGCHLTRGVAHAVRSASPAGTTGP